MHRARGKTSKPRRGVMNKTEAEFLRTHIENNPDVLWWRFEPMSLRLTTPPTGTGVRYTPDFLVMFTDGSLTCFEIKGTGPEDPASIVRVKNAAETFQLFTFVLCKKQTKKQGGGFKFTTL